MINDVKHFFHVLVGHLNIFSEQMLSVHFLLDCPFTIEM